MLRERLSGAASALAAVLILLASYQPSTGQELDLDEYAQTLVDAGNRTIALLLDTFRPNFPADKRGLLSRDTIGVRVFADFNAFSDYQNKSIIIPAQMVAETFVEAQAHIYVKNNPGARRHLDPWMRYLTERSRQAYLKFKNGNAATDDITIEPLWTFASLPTPPNLDSRDEQLQEQMMIDIIGLVLAHELGHLALDHKDYSSVSPREARRQEYAADNFAARLMIDSRRSILPGIMAGYARFAMPRRCLKRLTWRPARIHRVIAEY